MRPLTGPYREDRSMPWRRFPRPDRFLRLKRFRGSFGGKPAPSASALWPDLSERCSPCAFNSPLAVSPGGVPSAFLLRPTSHRRVDLASRLPRSGSAGDPFLRSGVPDRCLENAPRTRVGQGQLGRLIHFRPNCQWTRVDNSTAYRKLWCILASAAQTMGKCCAANGEARRDRAASLRTDRVAPAAADAAH